MKRIVIMLVAVIIATGLAYSWESGTHAYLMNKIRPGSGAVGANLAYGIVCPDLVNFMFTSPYKDYLYGQTHEEFLRLWRQAKNGPGYAEELALAYGFVCHNNLWGTDSAAHVAARTTLSALGEPEGYVITKARLLDQALAATWEALGIGGDEYAPLRLELCHEIIEIAVDVQVWGLDHTIGDTMVQAALSRSDAIRSLLKTAYAGNLVAYSNRNGMPMNANQARAILIDAENVFQQRMVLYGTIFMQSDQAAIELALGGYLAQSASAYGVTVTAEQVRDVIDQVLAGGLTADFQAELDATAAFVQAQLDAHGIALRGMPSPGNKRKPMLPWPGHMPR